MYTVYKVILSVSWNEVSSGDLGYDTNTCLEFILFVYDTNHISQLPCKPPDPQNLGSEFITFPIQVMQTSSDAL